MAALGLVFLAVMACIMLGGLISGIEALNLEELRTARKLTGGKINALIKDEKGEVLAELAEDAAAKVEELQADFDELDAAIKEAEAKAEKIKQRRERAARIDDLANPRAPAGDAPLVTNMHDNIADDPQGGFPTIGAFAQAVAEGMTPGRAQPEALRVYAAASGMSQGMGSEGGYAVPREYSTQIWDYLRQNEASLLSYCDVYTVTGESLELLAVDETTRASGSRYGGCIAYWISEAAQKTSTMPKLRRLKLEPQELAAFVYATDKLLRNAPALNQFIGTAMRTAVMAKVNEAILNGDGVGKPQGVLGGGGLISVVIETGQAAATLVPENVVKMWARRLGNPIWFMNQTVETQLLLMTLQRGTTMWPVYMPPGGLSASPYGSILGRPAITTEHCQALGTAGDIGLYDMKAYAVGMKGTVDSAISIHLRFDYNETAFRLVFEVDGQPWISSEVTPEHGDTRSPFVTLAARA